MRAVRRAAGAVVAAALLLALALALLATLRRSSQDLPWTKLDLAQPIGLFSGPRLAALRHHGPLCRALLDRAGVRYRRLPPVRRGVCGYDDAVRLEPGGSRPVTYAPAPPGTACTVAASLALWEWQVVQPAAQASFRSPVVAIEHYGSYTCRRIGGGEAGSWSEHATADAIDIAGFRLADGRHVTVAADWAGNGPAATFLHRVRSGACRVFATTLSPDYNAAHHNHLHLDQAARGEWRAPACR